MSPDHRRKVAKWPAYGSSSAVEGAATRAYAGSSTNGTATWFSTLVARSRDDNPFKGWFGVLWRIDDWAHRHNLHGGPARRLCDWLDNELTKEPA